MTIKRKDKRKVAVAAEFQVRIRIARLYLIKTDFKVNCTREFTPGSSIILCKRIFNVEKNCVRLRKRTWKRNLYRVSGKDGGLNIHPLANC